MFTKMVISHEQNINPFDTLLASSKLLGGALSPGPEIFHCANGALNEG